MANEDSLIEQSVAAASEALVAAEEHPLGGVGYLMALSKWQGPLYEETVQSLIKTVAHLFSKSKLMPPGLALKTADGVMPEVLPDRVVGARHCLMTLDAILRDEDPIGMEPGHPDEYLIGWLFQLFACGVALHRDEEERERVARQN